MNNQKTFGVSDLICHFEDSFFQVGKVLAIEYESGHKKDIPVLFHVQPKLILLTNGKGREEISAGNTQKRYAVDVLPITARDLAQTFQPALLRILNS